MPGIPFGRNSFSFGSNPFTPTPPASAGNRFGYDIPLPAPEPQVQQRPPIGQQQPDQFDFEKEYARINQPGKNRLAYQQLVDEGAPKIERSKWTRLAAALGAGAIATSPEAGSAQAGYNMGRSALEAPQVKATAEYERKKKALGDLAEFDEKDKATEIKGLEAKRQDWYNQKAEGRAVTAEQRAVEEHADQLKTNKYNRLKPITGDDGNTYLYDPETGVKSFVMKTGKTDEESVELARRKRAAEIDVEEPSKIAADKRRAQSDLESDTRTFASNERIAQMGVDGRANVAANNNQTKKDVAAMRNQNVLKALPPGQQITQVWGDVMQAGASDPLLANVAIEDYVYSIDGPGGTKIMKVKPPSGGFAGFGGGDSPQDALIKQKINQLINDSMTKSKTPGAGTSNTSGGRPNPATKAADPLGIR
jgi:hypothetical protein